MVTILNEGREFKADVPAGESLWLANEEIEQATGWVMKAEGFCRGETCVPVSDSSLIEDDRVNLSALWPLMGKPLAVSQGGDVWSLGESAESRNDAMLTLEAPDFTLPDLDGNLHSLTDFRRKKVLLITWASW